MFEEGDKVRINYTGDFVSRMEGEVVTRIQRMNSSNGGEWEYFYTVRLYTGRTVELFESSLSLSCKNEMDTTVIDWLESYV